MVAENDRALGLIVEAVSHSKFWSETAIFILEDDAQIMSNTQLAALVATEPPEISAEVIRINTEARHLALQVALLVPILAGLLGLLASLRMVRLPDPVASSAAEGMVLG